MNEPDTDGHTPAHVVAFKGHSRVAKVRRAGRGENLL